MVGLSLSRGMTCETCAMPDQDRVMTALQEGRPAAFFGTLAELNEAVRTLAIPLTDVHVHGTVVVDTRGVPSDDDS